MRRGGGVQFLCVYPTIPHNSLYLAERLRMFRRSSNHRNELRETYAAAHYRVRQCTVRIAAPFELAKPGRIARDPAETNGRMQILFTSIVAAALAMAQRGSPANLKICMLFGNGSFGAAGGRKARTTG